MMHFTVGTYFNEGNMLEFRNAVNRQALNNYKLQKI